ISTCLLHLSHNNLGEKGVGVVVPEVENPMDRWQHRLFTLCVVIIGLVCLYCFQAPAGAETCLSPYVKRLDRPEKYLYVFCVDSDAKDHDFLAVIDVDMDSSKYGTILYQLDLGSSGNETHHFGFTDDRTHIWGCSLFSNRIFLIMSPVTRQS